MTRVPGNRNHNPRELSRRSYGHPRDLCKRSAIKFFRAAASRRKGMQQHASRRSACMRNAQEFVSAASPCFARPIRRGIASCSPPHAAAHGPTRRRSTARRSRQTRSHDPSARHRSQRDRHSLECAADSSGSPTAAAMSEGVFSEGKFQERTRKTRPESPPREAAQAGKRCIREESDD